MLDKTQVTELVKFLVQLQAENLAVRKILTIAAHIGSAEMEDLIAAERQRLESIPVVAHALLRSDTSQLAVVLGTLSTVHP